MQQLAFILILIASLFGQDGDGDFSLGEISFMIKDVHIGGAVQDRGRQSELNNGIGALDIGLLKYSFSNIEISGDVNAYNERAKVKYKFSGPEFEMSNFKMEVSFDAPNIWLLLKEEMANEHTNYGNRERKIVKNNLKFTIGKVSQYFGASGSVDLNERNQVADFQLQKAGFSVAKVNANFTVDRSSKTTFSIADFKTEAKNIAFEFDTYDEIPMVEKAAFEISLKNLEINVPREVHQEPQFKEITDYLNINSGKFRIREINLTINFNRGKDLKIKATADTQFGKAVVDGSFSIRQPIRYDSDFTIDNFTVEISNLSRPIVEFIDVWEEGTGNKLPRKGKSIYLEMYGDIDNPQIKGLEDLNF